MAQEDTFHTFMNYPEDSPFPGILVPQKVYASPGAHNSHPTIRFIENGRPGILLSNALNKNCIGLQDGMSTPAVTDTSTRIAIRILWPGYDQWTDSVPVYDQSSHKRPYTLSKLAHVTAKIVKKFQDSMLEVTSTERLPDWWVSSVPFEELYLLELRHVSPGSWQPVLCRAVAC